MKKEINEDIKLINNIKNKDCNNSLVELTEKYSNLCFSVYRKFLPILNNTTLTQEEVNQDKYLIIYNAAKKFDSSKNTKFSTYLVNSLRYYFLGYLNKNLKYVNLEDKELNFFIEKNTKEEKSENTIKYIQYILEQINDNRIKKIYDLRYDPKIQKTRTWQQIAKKIGISTQGAINLHNKGIEIIKNKIKSKELYDKI